MAFVNKLKEEVASDSVRATDILSTKGHLDLEGRLLQELAQKKQNLINELPDLDKFVSVEGLLSRETGDRTVDSHIRHYVGQYGLHQNNFSVYGKGAVRTGLGWFITNEEFNEFQKNLPPLPKKPEPLSLDDNIYIVGGVVHRRPSSVNGFFDPKGIINRHLNREPRSAVGPDTKTLASGVIIHTADGTEIRGWKDVHDHKRKIEQELFLLRQEGKWDKLRARIADLQEQANSDDQVARDIFHTRGADDYEGQLYNSLAMTKQNIVRDVKRESPREFKSQSPKVTEEKRAKTTPKINSTETNLPLQLEVINADNLLANTQGMSEEQIALLRGIKSYQDIRKSGAWTQAHIELYQGLITQYYSQYGNPNIQTKKVNALEETNPNITFKSILESKYNIENSEDFIKPGSSSFLARYSREFEKVFNKPLSEISLYDANNLLKDLKGMRAEDPYNHILSKEKKDIATNLARILVHELIHSQGNIQISQPQLLYLASVALNPRNSFQLNDFPDPLSKNDPWIQNQLNSLPKDDIERSITKYEKDLAKWGYVPDWFAQGYLQPAEEARRGSLLDKYKFYFEHSEHATELTRPKPPPETADFRQ